MKILVFLFLIFSFNTVVYSQNEQLKIRWNEQRDLTWADFKAIPDESISFSANTNSGMGYTWNYSNSNGKPELNHEVYTNFYPNLSWVKDIQNEEYLLAHEQLHFDISELHSRKLRMKLQEYEIGRNIRQDLKKIYKAVESERVSMQNRFDKETSHSENKSAELQWRKFIAEQLIKYKEFAL